MLIEPEEWPIVMLFMRVQTQWRVGGMTGTYLGLDYMGVDVVMRRARIDDPDGRLFDGLQIMEVAALKALSNKS